jgi:protein-tyrosine phosphatase
MDERVIPLTGIHNLRDYGGYVARDGTRLRTGLLWRSGQHVDATPDDLDRIACLDLHTIIDLRGDSERAQHPCARHPEFAAEVLLVKGETAGSANAPHVEAARGVKTADDAHQAMVQLYKVTPFRPLLVDIFRLYVRALADRDGASLLHCLAGKDRTGLAVALVHDLMGVHPDDAMADYLLTNTAGNIDRRIAAGATTVRANFGPSMDEDAVRTLMSVHPEFLETAFTAICAQYGSVRNYCLEVLGVDAKTERRIAERLLV